MRRLLIFLLVMTLGVTAVQNIPVPGDCTTSPYTQNGGGGGIQDGRLHLDCTLSAINSEYEKTNFSVIPGHHTASLTVRCLDSVSRSFLEPQGFRSLIWLEELNILDCNLETVPDKAFFGLTRLRTLRISSTGPELTLTSHSMDGIANLRTLQISDLAVRFGGPASCLCSLPNLVRLNLRNTSQQSLESLGLIGYQSSCLRSLVHLDVSSNQLTGLASLQLPSLEVLDLQGNSLKYLDFDVFIFNSKLKVLNLTANSLVSLPSSLFPLPSLTHLHLANNSLATLPSRLLEGTPSLQYLDLSGNGLTDLKPGLFSNLTQLLSLDLSNNKINKIRRKLLLGLSSLETLQLASNHLEGWPGKAWRSLASLKTLDLSRNRIGSLANEAFTGLKSLEQLTLSLNGLVEVGNQTLDPLTSLLLLDLNNNKLTKIPSSLGTLSSLQSLDLSFNEISSLGDGSAVLPLPLLWRLNMAANRLEGVPKEAFRQLVSLQILDLSNNNIREVERDSFAENVLLKAVRLDGNRLKRMENLLTTLPSLTWLNMSANRLAEFDYAMLPRSLVWLDLRHNNLASLENYFGLESSLQIRHLDVGFNQLRSLVPSSVPSSVETVLLNDNRIIEIAPYTFFEKPNLKKVDLSVNNMSEIEMNALRVSSQVAAQPNFLLGGNPIQCNCHMLWFRTMNKEIASPNLPLIGDLESIYCRLPFGAGRQLTFAPLVDIQPSAFLCPYARHCFALCHCCDYDACDCEMACPADCSCYHDTTWATNIVECSATNATRLPPKLPMDATELLLDGNNLVKLKSHTFIGRKNLRRLYLNNSNIEVLENNTFNGLPSMLVLHLEDNRITKFEGDEFKGLDNLEELYLQDNLIASINNITFLGLKNLQILNLQGNRIVDYSVWSLSHNQFLRSVELSSNLWSCDCLYLEQLTGWVEATPVSVLDRPLLHCTTSQSTAIPIGSLEFCEEARGLVAAEETDSILNTVLAPAIAAAVTLIILLLALLVVLLYRTQIKLCLYSRYGVRFFQKVEGTDDQEKIYDGFVMYGVADDMYVQQVFASQLELGETQYRLCLYHRDVGPSNFVADSIIQACDVAKRTILVVSESFITQELSHYDFRTGLVRSLRALGTKLIVIILGDVKLSDLDPELRSILSLAATIHWGENKFWEKVRFHLPDRGEASRGLSQSTTLQSYPSTIHSFTNHYQAADLYGGSPRYELSPGCSIIPLLSPTSPQDNLIPSSILRRQDSGLAAGSTLLRSSAAAGAGPATITRSSSSSAPYTPICPSEGIYSRNQTTFREERTIKHPPPADGHRSQNMYTLASNKSDHIYQVCM